MNSLFAILKDFFSEFSRLKLFLLVFLSSVIAILLSLKFGGFGATAIIMVPAILSILQITKGVWTPEGGGKSAIGLTSLGVALLAILTNHTWRPFIDSLLEPLFSKYPVLKDRLPTDSPSILGLLFLGAVILIVNFFARDKTAMKEHPTPVDKEFPEREYKRLLKSFCGVLRDDLDRIDRETNWSAEIFTPLDAEVEIQSGNKRMKKVADLLNAIKSDRRSRVFLVLGDPGSGKSVSLRKLCRDLLQEVESTGRVPIYVNLREWERKELWTEQNPPSVEELYEFVFKNLADRGDVFTKDFLNKYYKKMFENGRLFIVLDSFDEVPAVLDVDESSWLIHKLSEVIHSFLAGAHESRGILASRIFRRPTVAFNAKTVLVLRPFTEIKIVELLRKSLFYDESLIKLLFTERQEFIPIARNPFTAALISSYAKEHENSLPKTQSELYSSYIEYRLRSCQEKIEDKQLTNDTIVACAIDIANVMLTTKTLGLEASLQQLQQSLPDRPITDVVDILRYARLARLGSGETPRFSFAHRRFNEYFVVKRIKEHPSQVPITNIPTDSRWRDALVLFAEVADENRAEQIAAYCWNEVKQLSTQNLKMSDSGYLRAVHCLRFLKDAFRARLNAISPFRIELAGLIKNELIAGENLVSTKIAVEAVGLLDAENMKDIITLALAHRSQWIKEVALRSCHYLPEAGNELKQQLRFFIDRLTLVNFLKRRQELILSLTLSNIFSDVRWHYYWRLIDTGLWFLAILLVASLTPLVGSMIIITLLAAVWVESKFDESSFSSLWLMSILSISGLVLSVLTAINMRWILDYSHVLGYVLPILFLISVPWYRTSQYISLLAKLRTNRILQMKLLILVLSLLIGIPFTRFLDNLSDQKKRWFIFLTSGIGISVIIVALLTYLIRLGKDYRKLARLSHLHFSTREGIAEEIKKMRTNFGRFRLVRFLDLEGKKPTGEWPEGKIPNFDNDRASTLLAQLEEKWLGLDR